MIELERAQNQHRDFPKTCELLNQSIGTLDGVASAASFAVWDFNKQNCISSIGFGQTSFDLPNRKNVTADTFFDLASLSKVLVMAPLAAHLVERGLLSFKTPVKEILPDFKHEGILLSHLLSHTSGMTSWAPFWSKLLEFFPGKNLQAISQEERSRLIRKWIYDLPLEEKTGSKVIYSDVGAILAGYIFEEVTGHDLDYLAYFWLWQFLGQNNLHFNPIGESSRFDLDQYAATEACPWRKKTLQGEVHDDNTWVMGGVSTHAGVFGTATDVVQACFNMVYGGFFSDSTLYQMFAKQTPDGEPPRSLGWDMVSNPGSSAGTKFSSHSFGHLGFTGTSVWMDLEAKIIICLLTNRVHPSRENLKIRELRPKFHDALRLDLGR